MTKNEINIEQVKQEPYTLPDSIFIPSEKFTKTTQFLLPAIDLNVKKPTIFQYFDNAYLNDDGYENNLESCVFVLFKMRSMEDPVWQGIYTFMQTKPEYVLDYNVGMMGEFHQVMIVFKVPEEWEDVYFKFKKGQYSKFSQEYKDKFPQEVYPDGKAKESIVWGAMNKSSKLKELVEREFFGDDERFSLNPETDEYWERPRRHREYFRCEPNFVNKFNQNIKDRLKHYLN